MKYILETDAAVENDIDEASMYYETRNEGLGDRLVAEIYQMIDLLLENPHLFQKRHGEYRIATTQKFNYKLIYRIYENKVSLISVQHPSQHPTLWSKRL